MYECINCVWKGEKLSVKPLHDKCPVCGDEVNNNKQDWVKESTPKLNITKNIFDLNKDGVVDKKDASIASKVMNKYKQNKKKRGKR